MNWDNILGGAIASLIALAFFEGVWMPVSRQRRLRRVVGKYHIHQVNGPAISGVDGNNRRKLIEPTTWLRDFRVVEIALALRAALGEKLFEDYGDFRDRVDNALMNVKDNYTSKELMLILKAVSWREETPPPVITMIHRSSIVAADPIRGLYDATIDGKRVVVEYEPDPDLRYYEQVLLLEDGGIEAFIQREVLPFSNDAWRKHGDLKIGYEISFTRHIYQPQPLRTLEQISSGILAVEGEAEGLLSGLLFGVN